MPLGHFVVPTLGLAAVALIAGILFVLFKILRTRRREPAIQERAKRAHRGNESEGADGIAAVIAENLSANGFKLLTPRDRRAALRGMAESVIDKAPSVLLRRITGPAVLSRHIRSLRRFSKEA